MPEHPLKTYEDLDPKFMQVLKSTRDLALEDSVLPKKTKLLIAMVLDAEHGRESGVQGLAQQAIKAGATKQEVMEALRVAEYFLGIGCIYTASRAFKDITL